MRYIVLLLVLLVGAGFVFINWPAVNAPAEVNLLITTAKAPITLMLLFWFSLLFVIVIYSCLSSKPDRLPQCAA